jgi:mercuric ion binding protein
MKSFLAIALLLAGSSVAAAPQIATLSVPTMSCASCPITIKAALLKVSGVASVKSDLTKRQTTVAFDDAKTDVAALTKATAAAGFPSTLAQAIK